MSIWISIPILGSLLILQTVILSRITLLHGSADLIMLAVISWALQKRVKTAWFWAIIEQLAIEMDPELAQIDSILDDDQLFQMIKNDMANEGVNAVVIGACSQRVMTDVFNFQNCISNS